MSKKKIMKTFPGHTLALDPETGVVEAYVSIMGILDDDSPPDLIENGAFMKTIQERGPAGADRIRVLWQHWWDEVIGKPLALVEHERALLPESVLAQYPEATGGLYAKTQLVMDVQRGRETYALYKAGAMGEWSIGFDVITGTWEKLDGLTFRRLKELRLWEYSPVTWGANPGTVTTSVKVNGIQYPVIGDQLSVTSSNGGFIITDNLIVDGEGDDERAEPQHALTREDRLRLKLFMQEFESRLRRKLT